MSFFAGLATGWGEGQKDYNSKMLDFVHDKNKSMAALYGHLADNADDPDMQGEFAQRAMGWAGANPLMDPKGYKALIKNEKTGLHDLADKKYQRSVSDYNQSAINKLGASSPAPAAQEQAQTAPPAPVAPAQNPNVAPSPVPNMDMTSQPTPPAPSMQGPTPAGPPMTGGPPSPSFAPPQGQAPQAPQAAPVPPMSGTPPADPTMDQYARSVIGPEPKTYGPTGRETMEHKLWRDAYTKRLEGTVPTPAGMRQFIGGNFMPQGFASPLANMMGREATANGRLAASGYKMVNGQVTPLAPEELSILANNRIAKDQASARLMDATIPLRQMMTEYTAGRLKMIPLEMKVRLEQLGMQQKHLELSELNTNAALFGRDLQGNPIPGVVSMPDGTVVGQRFAHNVLPTGATMAKAEMAIPVMEQISRLADFSQEHQDLFGRVSGNFMAFLASKKMTNDPDEGQLRAELRSLASLMVPLHGFRSQSAAEEFIGNLTQGMPPDAFMNTLRGFNAVGRNLYDNGMPQLIGGNGKAGPRMPMPPGTDIEQRKGAKGKIPTSEITNYIRKAGGDPNTPMAQIPAAVRRHAMDLASQDGWDVSK